MVKEGVNVMKLYGIKSKQKMRGYMTIEASFIIPCVFVIIFLLIYFGFYCFDRCVSLQNSYIVALRTSNQWEAGESQKKEYAKKEWEQITKDLFIFLEDKKFQIDVKGDLHTVGFCAEIENKLYEIFSFGPGKFQLSESMKARKIHPANVIRTYRLWR